MNFFLSLLITSSGLAVAVGPMPPNLSQLPVDKFKKSSACGLGWTWKVSHRGRKTVKLDLLVCAELIEKEIEEQVAEDFPASTELSIAAPAENSAMAEFWDSTRPKDAISGIGSGLKVAAGGILAGTAALFAAPVVEIREKGAVGILSGIGKGVGGFLGLTVGGVVAGSAQVVRGVLNTPEALTQSRNKKWDKERGAWIDQSVDLEKLIAEFKSEQEQDEKTISGTAVDSALYDVLAIKPTASFEEVKRAYYKQAMKLHPDKNRDDPDAHKKFQALGQAYQVLSDPDARKRYDQHGLNTGDQAMPEIDPGVFFSVLFGGGKLDGFIGKLEIASFATKMISNVKVGADGSAALAGDPFAADRAADRRKQLKREVLCAEYLLQKIKKFVEGDADGFTADCVADAISASRTNFGPQLLEAVGWAYKHKADRWMMHEREETFSRKIASFKNSARAVGQKTNMLASVAKAAIAAKRMHDMGEKTPGSTEFKSEFETALPVFLQTVWDMGVIDVQQTSKQVAKKLLLDVSVPWQVVCLRAQALQLLGEIFLNCGMASMRGLEVGGLEKALTSSFKR